MLYECITYTVSLNDAICYCEIIQRLKVKFKQHFELSGKSTLVCFKVMIPNKNLSHHDFGQAYFISDEEILKKLKIFRQNKKDKYFEENSKFNYKQFMENKEAILQELGPLVKKTQWNFDLL